MGGPAVELTQRGGRTVLVLEDPGGEPLDQLVGTPMELGQFLRVAIGLSAAVRQLHGRGLIHKDLKPANVLIEPSTGQVWLTGLGSPLDCRASASRRNLRSSSLERSLTWHRNKPGG